MRELGVTLWVVVMLIAAVPGIASGDPPRPGTTSSSLNESEEATLWARQSADQYVNDTKYRDAYDENRTTVHQVANGTDLTFTKPPSTAKRWTRYAHGTFDPGDQRTSRYPPTANTTNGTYIKDAHGTVFAVSPSTYAHVAPEDQRYYVPTEGRVLGAVDYRVEAPPTETDEDTRVTWRLDSSEISETRLYANGEELTNGSGSHRPDLAYSTDAASNLTLEADIEATLVREVHSIDGPENETESLQSRTTVGETVTVSDSIEVELYDLRATAHYAEYPNGETGASIYQTEPWQGYTLDEEGRTEVRGVWRFFTARNPDWDTLVESTSTTTDRVDSNALPVFVHAYPSKLGPRTKPEYAGPTILRTWGQQQASPVDSLPDNVTVDIVSSAYRPTYGLAVRTRTLDQDALTVHGIIRGTEATIIEQLDDDRSLQESQLTASIVSENETGVTVLLTLEDAETSDPIVLADDDRISPIADREREGYIEIDGQRVKTNATGEAVVHLTEQGVYTARYEPASWLESYPVYAGDSATVRWHALGTIDGWINLFTRFGLLLAPFAVMWYAGRRLGLLLRWRQPP